VTKLRIARRPEATAAATEDTRDYRHAASLAGARFAEAGPADAKQLAVPPHRGKNRRCPTQEMPDWS